jgi:hypothetical protein
MFGARTGVEKEEFGVWGLGFGIRRERNKYGLDGWMYDRAHFEHL